jgi:hypothetical protein
VRGYRGGSRGGTRGDNVQGRGALVFGSVRPSSHENLDLGFSSRQGQEALFG